MTMKAYTIKQVDAFTDRAFTGNPAAVLLNASGLSDEQLQLIAREMNLSETAFVFPATDSTHDLELRWFTPTKEVNLCGHATIATFHALAEEK
jgi:PhzF family phenazine biosynthesis protein